MPRYVPAGRGGRAGLYIDWCITLQDKLRKLQNRAASVLTYSNYDADVNNLFELLRWKSLVSQRQIEKATMVFKSLHLSISARNLSIAILVIV